MGNKRTPAACLSHYQQVLLPYARKKDLWSVAEDQQLARLVQQHGDTAWTVSRTYLRLLTTLTVCTSGKPGQPSWCSACLPAHGGKVKLGAPIIKIELPDAYWMTLFT